MAEEGAQWTLPGAPHTQVLLPGGCIRGVPAGTQEAPIRVEKPGSTPGQDMDSEPPVCRVWFSKEKF